MKPKIKKSTINEIQGVEPPKSLNKASIAHIKQIRKIQPSAQQLFEGILAKNKVSLSRAITLIESTHPEHLKKANTLIEYCLPYANQSIRIGITGVPGVGKSTFIEVFGQYLTSIGRKIAVLAIDPSSSISNGSILGDKTRMEELVKNENAFIRPSASGETLGGVAQKTRETIILCEACGFDTIIIETVGVGQSETAVHSMVDFFLLLKISGAGDELQGIKRGIMEMADAIVINKADGDNIAKAELAKVEFNKALHLFPAKQSGWTPIATTCSSYTKEGVYEVWKIISEYINLVKTNNFFYEHRKNQNQFWMLETVNQQLISNFYNHPAIINLLDENKKAVASNKKSPFTAALELLSIYFK